jgi:hypothetical protein
MPHLFLGDLPELVRKALDVSLTETSLPDEVILTPIYAGAARRAVLAADSTVEAINPLVEPDRWRSALAATAFLTAAKIAPSLPQIVERVVGDNRLRREKWDVDAAVKRLNAAAAIEIASLTDAESSSTRIAHFWTVAGGRGR